MHFVGIDLGWMGKPSGLARLRWDGKRAIPLEISRLDTHQDVLDAIPCQEPCWIGIDAPVLIHNTSGTRMADRACHELFYRQRAGAYPVHVGLPFAPGILKLIDGIRAKGFSTEVPLTRQSMESHVFEVYPHSASVRLFDLPQILPYKKGPLATRLPALREYRRLLSTQLEGRRPSLALPCLPETGETLAQMKACEDRLDAVLCAYVAVHFWYWGLARTNLLGHPPDGYIVNPSF